MAAIGELLQGHCNNIIFNFTLPLHSFTLTTILKNKSSQKQTKAHSSYTLRTFIICTLVGMMDMMGSPFGTDGEHHQFLQKYD
jgi:uncharacterized protein involved in propanediol utilization